MFLREFLWKHRLNELKSLILGIVYRLWWWYYLIMGLVLASNTVKKKWSFLLRISSVNVTKSAVSCFILFVQFNVWYRPKFWRVLNLTWFKLWFKYQISTVRTPIIVRGERKCKVGAELEFQKAGIKQKGNRCVCTQNFIICECFQGTTWNIVYCIVLYL